LLANDREEEKDEKYEEDMITLVYDKNTSHSKLSNKRKMSNFKLKGSIQNEQMSQEPQLIDLEVSSKRPFKS